jgi:hypothetical protein
MQASAASNNAPQVCAPGTSLSCFGSQLKKPIRIGFGGQRSASVFLRFNFAFINPFGQPVSWSLRRAFFSAHGSNQNSAPVGQEAVATPNPTSTMGDDVRGSAPPGLGSNQRQGGDVSGGAMSNTCRVGWAAPPETPPSGPPRGDQLLPPPGIRQRDGLLHDGAHLLGRTGALRSVQVLDHYPPVTRTQHELQFGVAALSVVSFVPATQLEDFGAHCLQQLVEERPIDSAYEEGAGIPGYRPFAGSVDCPVSREHDKQDGAPLVFDRDETAVEILYGDAFAAHHMNCGRSGRQRRDRPLRDGCDDPEDRCRSEPTRRTRRSEGGDVSGRALSPNPSNTWRVRR